MVGGCNTSKSEQVHRNFVYVNWSTDIKKNTQRLIKQWSKLKERDTICRTCQLIGPRTDNGVVHAIVLSEICKRTMHTKRNRGHALQNCHWARFWICESSNTWSCHYSQSICVRYSGIETITSFLLNCMNALGNPSIQCSLLPVYRWRLWFWYPYQGSKESGLHKNRRHIGQD